MAASGEFKPLFVACSFVYSTCVFVMCNYSRCSFGGYLKTVVLNSFSVDGVDRVGK